MSKDPTPRRRRRPATAPATSTRPGGWGSAVVALALGAVTVLGALGAGLVAVGPASAGSISSDRAEASSLAAQIAAENDDIDKLSQQYDQAQTEYQQTTTQIEQVKTQLAEAVAAAGSARRRLRQDALNAYMGDDDVSAVSGFFESDPNGYAARAEYQQLSDGALTTAIDQYQADEHQVSVEEGQLATQQSAEQVQLTSLQQTTQQAQAAVAQENAQLNSVNADLQQQLLAQAHALQVQQEEEQQQRAAQLAAQQAAASQASGGGGPGQGGGLVPPQPTTPVPPPSASWQQQAGVAVQTALAQVGTPYVWGGDSPGGFDCSGLVMYAWETAGVDLPHYSVDQYNDTTHITESELLPGDIVFYDSPDDGYLGHEALYIGGGQVVQAPETGMDVMVTSITWAGPPVAFGQPA